MLAKLNNSILKNIHGFTTDSQCLFYQKLNELLFHKTNYSYQYKLRNIHSILNEILEVIPAIRDTEISSSNLNDLINEAKTYLQNDYIIRTYYSDVQKTLVRCLKEKPNNKNELLALEYRIKTTLELITPLYFNLVIDSLEISINEQNSRQIEILNELLVTQLINKGWSTRGLKTISNYVFEKKLQYNFERKWRAFKRIITEEKTLFHCYIEFPHEDYSDELDSKTNIQFMTGFDILSTFPNINQDNIKKNGLFIEEKIEAFKFDLPSVSLICAQSFAKKQAILSFHHMHINFPEHLYIVSPNEKRLNVVRVFKETSKKTTDNEIDFDYSYNIIRNELVSNNDKERFTNFFSQYHISINSNSIESEYSSLWSALESLLVTGHHNNKIDHIKSIIPSLLANKYVYSILKNFLIDCYRVGVIPIFNNQYINIHKPSEEDIRKLFRMFQSQNELQNFKDSLKDYTLLDQRLEEISNILLNSESLKKQLEKHFSKISTHVQRLYRVRNHLVHNSHVEKDISLLLNHLHFYTRLTALELIVNSQTSDEKSIGQSLLKIEDSYQATIEVLNDNIRSSPKRGEIANFSENLIFDSLLSP
ncbi:hypothetical protein [Alkalicoccobacillus plakortidis]|uniref:Apea-like HEPN domain-containing protein n=1 Tax=Alkalicoccobacillus plakortidis TaxID=444060 RepID=A0ABT0XIE8_9BACI|nr:hypothetical protein [Alkalicoccobacillus plakortidis]MCM2675490.1 hypothetical protein [Alkalicoccobacillus plakortidis]